MTEIRFWSVVGKQQTSKKAKKWLQFYRKELHEIPPQLRIPSLTPLTVSSRDLVIGK
jgi:hypothetical protein